VTDSSLDKSPRPAASASAHDVRFNRPFTTGAELGNIQAAIEGAHLSGNGPFTRRCTARLEEKLGAAGVLLTHSCTGALEMAALLADVQPGDEVIMPSFTFTSTATAFALRGAQPVFVDIREDTLNLDEQLVEAAVTERTRVLVPVHYAGIACQMDTLAEIARRHDLVIVEDAAQALSSFFHGEPLGTIGTLGALSFHETKNVISGEGGALIVNDPSLLERAEVIHEKGTNRRAFFRGRIEKYSWIDIGSSFPASELAAAFLWAQLEAADWLIEQRLAIWNAYHGGLADLEDAGLLRRPVIPAGSVHNGHLYYVLLPSEERRDQTLDALGREGVETVFHYVPLHSSPAGVRFGRAVGELRNTERASSTLLRLPIWVGLSAEEISHVIAAFHRVLS
jgi:dTDP-4-amino-4,6-dideoxygalactose transaminase